MKVKDAIKKVLEWEELVGWSPYYGGYANESPIARKFEQMLDAALDELYEIERKDRRANTPEIDKIYKELEKFGKANKLI